MKLADLAKEIQTLKSLRHQRLIQLHAVCSAGEPVYIVTELMRKGNLQAFLGSECHPAGRLSGAARPPDPGAITCALLVWARPGRGRTVRGRVECRWGWVHLYHCP